MVIVGGITRLTGSGLSITEWNLVSGTLPPLSSEEWTKTFEKYKQTPQFLKTNSNYGINEFKAIFWWEYIHRLLGRVIGLTFMFPFLYFAFTNKLSRALTRKLLLLFGIGALQGFLGWYMVQSGLTNLPSVSHYRLAIHLISASILFAYSFHLALGLLYPPLEEKNSKPSKFRRHIRILLLLTFSQIIYGAFVAGLHAGKIYNTFPKMGANWVPPEIISLHPLSKNFTENIVTVQFLHRCIALLIGLLVLSLEFAAFENSKLTPKQKQAIHILTTIFLIQISLGILTLLTSVSIPFAICHQAGSFFLLSGALYLTHRL